MVVLLVSRACVDKQELLREMQAEQLSSGHWAVSAEGGGLGGLLGSMTIAAGLSKRKAALDKCGKGETRAHIWQKGGKVTKALSLARKDEVDDILGGNDAWSNVDRTEATCSQ